MRPFDLPPARESNAYPLTDAAEVRECRRILYETAPGAEPDWLSIEEAADWVALLEE